MRKAVQQMESLLEQEDFISWQILPELINKFNGVTIEIATRSRWQRKLDKFVLILYGK